ncbi:homoserine kinase [Gallionella capsiferriformans]|jgi:homoserine kinase type II|uniref:Homoserine kinase n=1 Tax=Gallionella capsiferriformans (strain ES-2) TaxID=395494 RepID=D9SIV4_GALCS|nr:homoserine kinase [Gallionella capsiferriformans]ADL54230.1 homoserine kinase [Gallionella capsiferriformans ES-2]
MSVYTTVSDAELTVWLNDYSLGELQELQGIASGIENTNYFVTTSNGRFVLTLFEKLRADELPFYLNLMAHLARHGIPCPAPMANRHNQFLGVLKDKPACIVSRLSGKSTTAPTLAHCAAMGAMLGQMHIAGQSFSQIMPNPRGGAWRMATAPQVRPFINTGQAALLDSEIALHAQRNYSLLPQGLIHADLFRDNVLLEGERVGGLIDFYFACTDALLYDVAITVNDWCMRPDGILDTTQAQTFLRAYHTVRPLQDSEHQAWPLMLRQAALRFWLSRLFDKYLPRDGELIHAHDPAHFERILKNHIDTSQAVWI